MSSNLEEFHKKFRTHELTVFRSEHWTWAVRPAHSTLGAGILSLNRFCTNFGSLSEDEAKDLSVIVKEIERRLARSFGPAKYNYIMLMMVDLHLHFHVIPRYDRMLNFAGLEWKDAGWPGLPQLGDGANLAESPVLVDIRDELRR